MKPHIYKAGALWYCRFKNQRLTLSGIGFTPLEAYKDWKNFEGGA